jgi:serine/threonine-protein kinase RsbW
MGTASSLRIAAEVKDLAEIRQFVAEQARALDVDQFDAYDLILAVNEIATNIIVHGYRGQRGVLEVEMRKVADSIEVRLRDQAPLFDPTRVSEPDISLPLHKRPFGGMGIHVTKQLMDEMIYRAQPQGGNEVILVKRGIAGTSPKEQTDAHDP